MHEKGVPPKARRYILNAKEQLRRGVLTFEYLQRRTSLEIAKKKWKNKNKINRWFLLEYYAYM